jgi:hypothetical protein
LVSSIDWALDGDDITACRPPTAAPAHIRDGVRLNTTRRNQGRGAAFPETMPACNKLCGGRAHKRACIRVLQCVGRIHRAALGHAAPSSSVRNSFSHTSCLANIRVIAFP